MGRPYYGAARSILRSSPPILVLPVREGYSFSIRWEHPRLSTPCLRGVTMHEVAMTLSHVMWVSSIPHGYGGYVLPVREGCSFSIRIAGGAGVPVHGKTSVLVPIGKARTRKVRGFSMSHATDSEAYLPRRALLFAEHHTTDLEGQEPAATTLMGPRVVMQSSVSEPSVETGQHRKRLANRKE